MSDVATLRRVAAEALAVDATRLGSPGPVSPTPLACAIRLWPRVVSALCSALQALEDREDSAPAVHPELVEFRKRRAWARWYGLSLADEMVGHVAKIGSCPLCIGFDDPDPAKRAHGEDCPVAAYERARAAR